MISRLLIPDAISKVLNAYIGAMTQKHSAIQKPFKRIAGEPNHCSDVILLCCSNSTPHVATPCTNPVWTVMLMPYLQFQALSSIAFALLYCVQPRPRACCPISGQPPSQAAVNQTSITLENSKGVIARDVGNICAFVLCSLATKQRRQNAVVMLLRTELLSGLQAAEKRVYSAYKSMQRKAYQLADLCCFIQFSGCCVLVSAVCLFLKSQRLQLHV